MGAQMLTVLLTCNISWTNSSLRTCLIFSTPNIWSCVAGGMHAFYIKFKIELLTSLWVPQKAWCASPCDDLLQLCCPDDAAFGKPNYLEILTWLLRRYSLAMVLWGKIAVWNFRYLLCQPILLLISASWWLVRHHGIDWLYWFLFFT